MSRRLIVCADGTWNTKDQEDEGHLAPTNVVKMYEAIRRRPVADDNVPQIAYYHPGVGTKPNLLERGAVEAAKLLHIHSVNRNIFEGATGEGVDRNIKECYHWLVTNYRPGDEVYLFGFSRGAYTVRSLAGLIRNSGILTDYNTDLIDEGFELYRDRSPDTAPDSQQSRTFRKTFAHEADITCIGVWDTVGAMGIPLHIFEWLNEERFGFHDVTLGSHIRHAYHALAIDEHRKPFAPALWTQAPDAKNQVLEQTWFPGAHCNVGGGYADCGLSDNTFLWMAERASRPGLQVDDGYVRDVICNSCWNGKLRDSMAPPFDLSGRHLRPIAAGRSARDTSVPDLTKETVHKSALERYGKDVPPHYMPENLADYLERFPMSATAESSTSLRSAQTERATATSMA